MSHSFPKSVQNFFKLVILGCFATWHSVAFSGPATGSSSSNEIQIAELQVAVEISNVVSTNWMPAQANQLFHPFDRLRTVANSHVALLWFDQSVLPLGA